MKKIEIIPLAERKFKKRRINKKWIIETLQNPDQIVSGYGERKVAQKKYQMNTNEYLLRVVYEEHEELLLVITAYLTSKISRYWEVL